MIVDMFQGQFFTYFYFTTLTANELIFTIQVHRFFDIHYTQFFYFYAVQVYACTNISLLQKIYHSGHINT